MKFVFLSLSRPGVGFSPLSRRSRTHTFLPLPKVHLAGLLALTNHITLPRCCRNSTVFPLANPASVPKPTRKKESSKWQLFLKVFEDLLFPFWMSGVEGWVHHTLSFIVDYLHYFPQGPYFTFVGFLLVFITSTHSYSHPSVCSHSNVLNVCSLICKYPC